VNLSEEETTKTEIKDSGEANINAPYDSINKIVHQSLLSIEQTASTLDKKKSTGRAILTAFGYNHPGVVSEITKALSDADCDIQDISQKIMQEFFTMIMLIDVTNSSIDLRDIQEVMNKISSKLGIKIFIQHEDVFRYMHRI
jgi:ACT domain-containing protein